MKSVVSFRVMSRCCFTALVICSTLLFASCDSGGDDNGSGNLDEVSFTDRVAGDGAEVQAGDVVSIRYVVKSNDDGAIYDSSTQGLLFNISLATGIFTFVQGSDDAIEGLNMGILGMKGGGTRDIQIPFNMAWGRGIDGVVPTREDILMEVELLKRPEFTVITAGDGAELQALDTAFITFDSQGVYTTRPFAAADHIPYLLLIGRGVSGRIVDSFPGAMSKMAGLHLVLQDMRVGDVYEVTIPPELGFGTNDFFGVPGNSTIVTELAVVDVN